MGFQQNWKNPIRYVYIMVEIDCIKEFKKKIKESEIFSNLTFREMECNEQVYHKLTVKIRDEIVVFGGLVDLNKRCKHIEPEELKAMLDNKEDVTLLDARDEHEHKVGKFKNALTLPIESFNEFSKTVNILEPYKNDKIVMYCTGGIRCEKSSAFLNQKGFQKVHQLKGGIIDFINKFPNTYFEGSCFVFDDRLTASNGRPISICVHCGNKNDKYINCHNLDCDRLFVCCDGCGSKNNFCCSIKCKDVGRHRKKVAVVVR